MTIIFLEGSMDHEIMQKLKENDTKIIKRQIMDCFGYAIAYLCNTKEEITEKNGKYDFVLN